MNLTTIAAIKELFETLSVYEAVEEAQKQFGLPYPKSPAKPILKPAHTLEDVEKYAKELGKYEIAKSEFKIKITEYHERSEALNEIYKREICDKAGLDSVPLEYQEKVWAHAWESGHSAGYSEVYNNLSSLIEIFL